MFLKVTQKAKISIKIADRAGNDAKIDGLPQWALSNPDLGSLMVAEDGLSAEFSPTGVLGAVKVQVNVDADLGPDVKPVLGELDLEVVAGDAEIVKLSGEII